MSEPLGAHWAHLFAVGQPPVDPAERAAAAEAALAQLLLDNAALRSELAAAAEQLARLAEQYATLQIEIERLHRRHELPTAWAHQVLSEL